MRIIEGENDNLRLPGPWNRPRGGNRDPGGAVSGQPGGEPHYQGEGEEEDRPLSGPWSRRERPSSPEQPPEPQPEPRPEHRPKPRPKVRRQPPPDPEFPRPAEDDGYAAGPPAREADTVPVPAAAVGEAAGGEAGDRTGRTCEKPMRERIQSPEAYLRKILSPGGVYAGVVMAEILGSRGGRWRRR